MFVWCLVFDFRVEFFYSFRLVFEVLAFVFRRVLIGRDVIRVVISRLWNICLFYVVWESWFDVNKWVFVNYE